MTKYKTCTECEARLLRTAFGRNAQSKDGLHYYCKVCAALKRKTWYEANKVKAKQSTKKWLQHTAALNAMRDPYGA